MAWVAMHGMNPDLHEIKDAQNFKDQTYQILAS